MKIKREVIPEMTIEEFADANNLVMRVNERRVPTTDPNRYYAYFEGCEVMESGFLISESGNGMTENDAINDYAKRISLKRIAFHAYGPDRLEINVPRLIGMGAKHA